MSGDVLAHIPSSHNPTFEHLKAKVIEKCGKGVKFISCDGILLEKTLDWENLGAIQANPANLDDERSTAQWCRKCRETWIRPVQRLSMGCIALTANLCPFTRRSYNREPSDEGNASTFGAISS